MHVNTKEAARSGPEPVGRQHQPPNARQRAPCALHRRCLGHRVDLEPRDLRTPIGQGSFYDDGINTIEKRSALHVALRGPATHKVVVDDVNVVAQRRAVLERGAIRRRCAGLPRARTTEQAHPHGHPDRWLAALVPPGIRGREPAREAITFVLDHVPGNGAAIGRIKVVAKNSCLAAGASGSEAIYKIQAESFGSKDHLQRILKGCAGDRRKDRSSR